ncbi:MAG: OprO/OprP family phosphate-selective porin [Bacteroidia bacterium]|nr:OprO/OprP family phosphate-selective porin [Bacteroidia bacterium]
MQELRLVVLLLLVPAFFSAQKREMQTGDTTYYKTLIPEEKQGLLKNMSMIANMRFAERNEFTNGDFTGSRFVNEQFRLEIKGQVTDKVYFRFRDRYTRAQTSESVDNISRSTDMAYVRVDVTDWFNISGGKMCASWGGIEFDMNPIDIYEYSDIVEYADNFLTGVRFNFKLNSKHSLTFEGLDSRTKTFNELYGAQPDVVVSKVPMAFVANWMGSMFNGKFNTIWAYAYHNEAENLGMHYLALGNQLKLGKFTLEYDFQYSDEDLDRTTIVSNLIPDSLYAYSVKNTLYIGHWLHLHYRITKKWNVALVGVWNIANWNSTADPLKNTNHISDSYQYIPTIEYYPTPTG